jgi:hypothetical protein
VTTKDFKRECDGRLLIRHAAVIWIQQCRKEGHPVGECLQRAACLDWAGRYYAARTLEDWYYAHQARGAVALDRQRRSDRGKGRQRWTRRWPRRLWRYGKASRSCP